MTFFLEPAMIPFKLFMALSLDVTPSVFVIIKETELCNLLFVSLSKYPVVKKLKSDIVSITPSSLQVGIYDRNKEIHLVELPHWR